MSVPSARAVVLVAAIYALVGIVFAWPLGHVRAWRLAAWLISAAAFAAHIAYERLRRRSPSRQAALRVASAVALGAFGLALGAIVHSWPVVATTRRGRLLLVALVAWPILTGVPAFLVALVASVVVGVFRAPADGGVAV